MSKKKSPRRNPNRKRKKRPKRYAIPSLTISAHGLELGAWPRALETGLNLKLVYRLKVPRSTSTAAHFRVRTDLSSRAADLFIAELADACGYDVGQRGRGLLGTHAWAYRRHPGDQVFVRLSAKGASGSYCGILLTKRQALRLLRFVAEHCGWDLE